MSRKVVAFDLGGVVVDVDKAPLAHLGDARAVDAAFFGARHDAVSTGALGGDAYCAAVAADLGVAADVVARAWARVVRWRAGARALFDDVAAHAAVAAVRCWSNTDPVHWRALGLDATDACTSFRVGFMKPDPHYFARVVEHVAAATGVAAADIVYVDDRADNVAAAVACGVDAVVVESVDDARAAIFARL